MNRHAAGVGVVTAINEQTGEREVRDFTLKTYQDFPESVISVIRNPGIDTISDTSILPGRVEPATDRGGLWIRANAFQLDGASFPTAPEDAYLLLDTSGITASMSVAASIYADPADRLLHVALGTERALAWTYSQADFDAIALPYGVVPLAGWVLKAGQTSAADSYGLRRPFDRRPFIDANGVVSPGWLVKTDTAIPAGVSMVQAGAVRAVANLNVYGSLYII